MIESGRDNQDSSLGRVYQVYSPRGTRFLRLQDSPGGTTPADIRTDINLSRKEGTMKKRIVLLLTFGLMLIASAAFAEEAESAAKAVTGLTSAVAALFAIAIAAFGGSIGMGLSISRAMEGIARNPEASGKIMTTMIIGLALIESLAIYTLVIIFIKA